MKGKITILLCTACSVLFTSCLFSYKDDIAENLTLQRLYGFTDSMSKKSIDGPVSALNGLDDESLFSFTEKEMKGCGASFYVRRIGDSLWCAESLMEGVNFKTEVTLLPNPESILGITKHNWSARTEGSYFEDNYSAVFRSLSDFMYFWSASDSKDEVRVKVKRKGSMQVETLMENKVLDSGTLTLAGSAYSFQSTKGVCVGTDEPF